MQFPCSQWRSSRCPLPQTGKEKNILMKRKNIYLLDNCIWAGALNRVFCSPSVHQHLVEVDLLPRQYTNYSPPPRQMFRQWTVKCFCLRWHWHSFFWKRCAINIWTNTRNRDRDGKMKSIYTIYLFIYKSFQVLWKNSRISNVRFQTKVTP